MPEFETFDKSSMSSTQSPTVTIHKRGTITINAGAYARLGRPAAVELMYQRNTAILGLRAVGVDVAHAAYVRPAHRLANGPWVISAMAFVRHFAIDTSATRQWTARMDGDILIADLSVMGLDVGRESGARQQRIGPSDGRNHDD